MTNQKTLLLLCLALGACDGTTSPGTDSGSMMGTDGGPMTDTGSMLGQPAEVTIQFGGCTDFTACGGDPTGTWDYDSICIEDPFADVRDACGTITFEDTMGTARGRVRLDGATVSRDVTVMISATAIFDPSCAIAGCDTIEGALRMALTSASCAANAGGGCDCAISETVRIDETDGYRVEGTQVITDDGTTYDFCVAGGTMQHREIGENPDEPGILGLTRR